VKFINALDLPILFTKKKDCCMKPKILIGLKCPSP